MSEVLVSTFATEAAAPTEWPERESTAVLEAIVAHRGPLIVDLDETLFLRNSTEEFLDGASPKLFWYFVFKLLDIVKPWRCTGGNASRDVWRVRIALTLCPGLVRRWHQRVAGLASAHLNHALAQALRASGNPVIVATLGFDRIVHPLLAAMGFHDVRVVACRAGSLADRRKGKLAMVEEALGADSVRQALVITDSRDDTALLQSSRAGWLVRWPQARYRAALSGTYAPFRYVMLVKRPGESYVRRGILLEDFAFWILSCCTLATRPWHLLCGLAFLLLSFWSIYELGYADNDRCAERLEELPKLSSTYVNKLVDTPSIAPWLWAIAAGAAGMFFLEPTPDYLLFAGRWGAVLLITHAVFRIYNRIDKSTRVWLFAGLQLLRVAAFAVVVPITVAGGVVLAAHTIARWLPYYQYRQVMGLWPPMPVFLVRLLFFVLIMVTLTMATAAGHVWDASALLILGWCLFRARSNLNEMFEAAHRLDRPTDSK